MPKKTTKQNKERRLELRVETEWYEVVEAEARRLGLSVASYLRVAAVEKMDRDKARRELPTDRN